MQGIFCTRSCEALLRCDLAERGATDHMVNLIIDVVALHQLLQKLELALAVQLKTEKNSFNAFLCQVRVPSVLLPLSTGGSGHQTAKHSIIHCPNILAARHLL
jgi:polyphosphate kinase